MEHGIVFKPVKTDRPTFGLANEQVNLIIKLFIVPTLR